MACDGARWANEGITRELRERGTLLPPWLRFPELPRYSIGWRMGSGEDYLILHHHWTANWTRDDWLTYLRRHAPVPADWYDWACWQLGLEGDEHREDDEDEDDGVDREEALAALGLTAPPA